MKKIILCCAGGMSSSLLVQRMQKIAAQRGVPYPIEAIGVTQAELRPDPDAACILIGPQVRFSKELVEQANPDIPVALISMVDYGRMNAENVLNQALGLMDEPLG